eukprot:GHVO01044837.1.p1 GENE.GHVO01044837.1~~GHVO01044837.1.p1  ORF type:complete len:132 (+),score=26.79 GHVO01044837.1:42-437(+)
MTGIESHPTIKDEWMKMKLKKQDYNFIIMKIDDAQKYIVVDKAGLKKDYPDFASFLKVLPKDDARFAVVEVGPKRKLCFVLWAPDGASVKAKMVYAASQKAIQNTLDGHAKYIHASDLSDLDEKQIIASLG